MCVDSIGCHANCVFSFHHRPWEDGITSDYTAKMRYISIDSGDIPKQRQLDLFRDVQRIVRPRTRVCELGEGQKPVAVGGVLSAVVLRSDFPSLFS